MHQGTESVISCIITGITKQLDDVVWKKNGNPVSTISAEDFVEVEGVYANNAQTTKLTVKSAEVTDDTVYTCVITSNEWLTTDKETAVPLNVYGEFWFILPPILDNQYANALVYSMIMSMIMSMIRLLS